MITNNISQDMQVWTYCVDRNTCVGGVESYYWVPAGNPSPVYIPACPSGDVDGCIFEYRDYVQGGSANCVYETSILAVFTSAICNNGSSHPNASWNTIFPYPLPMNCTDSNYPGNYQVNYNPGTLDIMY